MNETKSICKECGEETKFRWTTSSKTWAECLNSDCGKKYTTIKNHRFSPQITTEMIILPFEEEYFEPVERFSLEDKLADALEIADSEELAEKKERKKTLLEQQETRREVTDYFDKEEDYEPFPQMKQPPLREYEEHTRLLLGVLGRFNIKKPFVKYIIELSEESHDGISPPELREYLTNYDSGISKAKQLNLIIDSYERELDRYIEEDAEIFSPRMRQKDKRYRRDRSSQPEPMNIQDFIQMEQAKQAREAIQNQLADKNEQIGLAQYQMDEWKKKADRIEDEMKELKKDHKQEIKELQARIETFRDKLFDARLDEVKVQASQSFTSDATKLLDKALEKGVLSKTLATISDLNRPLPPTQQKQSQLPPPQPVAKEEVQKIAEMDEILSAFGEEDIID